MKILKKTLKWLGILILILVAVGAILYMIYLRPFMQKMKETTKVQYDKELTLILGGGGNSGILVSDSLVMVIDTKMDEAAEQLAKTVKEMAGNKPVLVINTHYHPDHTGGNQLYKGSNILAGGNYTEAFWKKEVSKETLPTIWLKDKMDIKMADDTVTIFNLDRNAHTISDVFVYLHKRKMLFGGDVILNKQAPAILLGGGDPEGYLYAFDLLPKKFDIKTIVPGHGPVGGIELIDTFRQYFLDMQTAANDPSQKDGLIAKYKDWAQVPIVMSPGATVKAWQKKTKQ